MAELGPSSFPGQENGQGGPGLGQTFMLDSQWPRGAEVEGVQLDWTPPLLAPHSWPLPPPLGALMGGDVAGISYPLPPGGLMENWQGIQSKEASLILFVSLRLPPSPS